MAALHVGRSKLVATKSAVAVNCDPPGEGGRGGDRGGYGVGEKAAFLIRRISRESIFVKPKHLPPISFSEAPMR